VTGAVAIAAGNFHSLALKSDSTVWAWGWNGQGQLGNGTFTTARPWGIATPAQVPGLTGVVAIAAGGHSLALKPDGAVWAWGDNQYGQLGSGSFTPSAIASPAPVPGLTGVVAISAGGGHSLALKSDGTVWAWGWNSVGQLGSGAFTTSAPYGSATPAQVPGLTGAVAISAGGRHSLAIKSDGTVLAWGNNYHGQLGNGAFTTTDPRGIATPAQVPGPTGVGAISAGGSHSLAIKSDGTVWAWGWNGQGQLGNGTVTGTVNASIATPASVTGLSGA